MANLVKWIEDEAGNEKITAVVIGPVGGEHMFGDDDVDNEVGEKETRPLGKVMMWSEAKELLNYEFSSDFGCVGCHAVYVWTKSSVLFVTQYDGSTSLGSVPRHPVDVIPEMPGG